MNITNEAVPAVLRADALLDLTHTIAAALFDPAAPPWAILPGIAEFIRELGGRLSAGEYDHTAPDVWIAKDAAVAPGASISGPCIIDHGAEIRHCAFIRGSAIVGKKAVVGNSSELKNVILFDEVQTPHYNYVGDSILGWKAHMGAGAITSNVRADKANISVHAGVNIHTGLRKFGAVLGDHAEIGCNAVLNPGTIVGRGSRVYPLSSVRGVVPERSIYKTNGETVRIRTEKSEG